MIDTIPINRHNSLEVWIFPRSTSVGLVCRYRAKVQKPLHMEPSRLTPITKASCQVKQRGSPPQEKPYLEAGRTVGLRHFTVSARTLAFNPALKFR